jgi:hypothetical protein
MGLFRGCYSVYHWWEVVLLLKEGKRERKSEEYLFDDWHTEDAQVMLNEDTFCEFLYRTPQFHPEIQGFSQYLYRITRVSLILC